MPTAQGGGDSLGHIKIQGGGEERIQRPPVCCPHIATAPSTGSDGGRRPLQEPWGRHQSTAASYCHSGLSVLPPPWPTLSLQKQKEGKKGSAIQSISYPEMLLCNNLRKRRKMVNGGEDLHLICWYILAVGKCSAYLVRKVGLLQCFPSVYCPCGKQT